MFYFDVQHDVSYNSEHEMKFEPFCNILETVCKLKLKQTVSESTQ